MKEEQKNRFSKLRITDILESHGIEAFNGGFPGGWDFGWACAVAVGDARSAVDALRESLPGWKIGIRVSTRKQADYNGSKSKLIEIHYSDDDYAYINDITDLVDIHIWPKGWTVDLRDLVMPGKSFGVDQINDWYDATIDGIVDIIADTEKLIHDAIEASDKDVIKSDDFDNVVMLSIMTAIIHKTLEV